MAKTVLPVLFQKRARANISDSLLSESLSVSSNSQATTDVHRLKWKKITRNYYHNCVVLYYVRDAIRENKTTHGPCLHCKSCTQLL